MNTPSHPPYCDTLEGYTQKLGFMEKFWCTQKNSIIDMMNGKEIPIALTPCRKSECDRWRSGECIQIRKAGKPEKSQVFSKQD